MEMADPDRGIVFGATPVETLHAFHKALVEMVTHVVIDNIPPPSKTAVMDRFALRVHKTHRQCVFSTFPSTTFCNGIANISKITAERLGLVFLGHYDEGWTIALDNCHNKTEPIDCKLASIGSIVKPTFHIKWDTKTYVSTLQMDNELLHYLYNNFGPTVDFCT
jgi:hypothetical protein